MTDTPDADEGILPPDAPLDDETGLLDEPYGSEDDPTDSAADSPDPDPEPEGD